ncbi:hypothetical protein I7I53_09814 [Histoplasma capsulatum var. duboisii H88]|uniref:Serine protease n=2 Tax=Ajellomyces capsulatus (strain H88) TaxID=544711 RepID=A0A8A1L759_AJEC8|nr:hypothetical protein I7I53_09814 [Histoplasma capsulatum var. duboisii H88]
MHCSSVTRFAIPFTIVIISVTAVPLFRDSKGSPIILPNLDAEELIQMGQDRVVSYSSFWNTGNGALDTTLVADSGSTLGYNPIETHQVENHPQLDPWAAENAYMLANLNPNNTGLYYRDRVVSPMTYPWNTIGRLFFQRSNIDNGGWCTGSLVGRNLILTASHCFPWGYGRNRWMRFSPGFGNGVEPYGSSYVSQCRGVKNTFNVTGIDYIVCQLCEPLGDLTGWMGTKWWKDGDSYMGRPWRSSGYPTDAFQGNEQMLLSNITLLNVDFHGRLGKELETRVFASPGWSGGPMWEYIDGQPTIVGVCSGGEKDCSEEVGGCNGIKDSSLYHDVSAGGRLMTDLVAYGLAHWNHTD